MANINPELSRSRATRELPPPAPASGRDAAPHTFRPELQALRALAVTLVVLYHAWPERVPGGYVGVHVFFVISGYLITKHLLDEARRKGTFSVSEFWARRARRLLPASLLVLVLSAALTFACVPQGLWKQYFREISASALYVQNWVLASDSVDYLAGNHAPSLVQHFWTLSAEEQFYLALPLLLLAALRAGRRLTSAARRRVAFATLACACAGSFAYSSWLSLATPSVAYFSTGARAWEFGVGALLAFRAAPARVWLWRSAAAAGVAAIVASGLEFHSGTVMPGLAALMPVLGAASIIAAGGGFELARWTRWRPLQVTGDISYSIYLWHWPALVAAPHWLGRPLRLGETLFALLVTLSVAWATTRWVEDPIRHGRWPRRPLRPRTVALLAAAGMGLVLSIADRGSQQIRRLELASAAASARLQADDPPCFGAKATRHGERCEAAGLADVLVPHPPWSRTTKSTAPIAARPRARPCACAPSAPPRVTRGASRPSATRTRPR